MQYVVCSFFRHSPEEEEGSKAEEDGEPQQNLKTQSIIKSENNTLYNTRVKTTAIINVHIIL